MTAAFSLVCLHSKVLLCKRLVVITVQQNKTLKDCSMLSIMQEAAMQEKQAAQKEAAERRAKVAEVERHRKQQTSLLRKRTRSGQPVMRHRIDKLLESLQQ